MVSSGIISISCWVTVRVTVRVRVRVGVGVRVGIKVGVGVIGRGNTFLRCRASLACWYACSRAWICGGTGEG